MCQRLPSLEACRILLCGIRPVLGGTRAHNLIFEGVKRVVATQLKLDLCKGIILGSTPPTYLLPLMAQQ